MRTDRLKSREGFTLIEVLVALGILIIGIVGVMQLFPTSLDFARQASERTITSQTAHSILGQIRASSAEALFLGQIPESLQQLNRSNNLYGYRTTIDRVAGASQVYLQRVTFTVTFADERTESFTTYVARR